MTRRLPSFALGLLAVVLLSSPALAQRPDEVDLSQQQGQQESGRPVDGYLATGVLAGIALFAVAKSARR